MLPAELVGARIRGLREEAGLSIRALASRIGKAPSTLISIETGASSVTIDVLVSLSEELDVPIEILVSAAMPYLGTLQPDGSIIVADQASDELTKHGIHSGIYVGVAAQHGMMSEGDRLYFDYGRQPLHQDGEVVLADVGKHPGKRRLHVGEWRAGRLLPLAQGGTMFWGPDLKALAVCTLYVTRSPNTLVPRRT